MCEFPKRVVLVVPWIFVFHGTSLLPQWHAARWHHIMFPASRCSWASGHAGKNGAGMCSGEGEGVRQARPLGMKSDLEMLSITGAYRHICHFWRERDVANKPKRGAGTWDAPLLILIQIQISEVQYRPITTELNRLKIFLFLKIKQT